MSWKHGFYLVCACAAIAWFHYSDVAEILVGISVALIMVCGYQYLTLAQYKSVLSGIIEHREGVPFLMKLSAEYRRQASYKDVGYKDAARSEELTADAIDNILLAHGVDTRRNSSLLS